MTTGCYMCDENTVLDSKKSDEHIIPQSLGSPLSRFDMLSEALKNDLAKPSFN